MNESGDGGMQTSQVSKVWFFVAAATLFFGALLANTTLLGIGLLLAATLGVSWLWARYSLAAISYERIIDPPRANFGETIDLGIRITNRKPLPLAWLEIADEAPQQLPPENGTLNAVYRPGRAAIEWRVSLDWYERVTRHYTIRAARRGDYTYGPVTMRAGDIFGLFSRTMTLADESRLLIYPRIVPVTAFGIPAREPFGESRSVLPLVADPLRPQGIRPYVSGDSPRHIHWRASARSSEIQTRLFDPAATPQVWLFCNQQTFDHEWEGIDVAGLELAIVVAASLANHALEEGYAVALEANAYSGQSDQHIRIGASTSPEQLPRILESLARLHGWSGVQIEAIIERERRSLPWGASVIVVSTKVSDWLLELLFALRRSGHPVTLVEVDGGDGKARTGGDMSLLGITYYRVSGDGERAYREIESLALA